MSAPDPFQNSLLATLPRPDAEALIQNSTALRMSQGEILCEADDEVDNIYFPVSGMISLVIVMKTGKAIETATIGREGVFGAMAGLGLHVSAVRAIVQISLATLRVPAPAFRRIAAASLAIGNMCVRYNEILLDQARITAACNALHPVEARFCRWILQTSDRARSDTINLTQEFLSEMLGVRRTSVTDAAQAIQAAGVITYSRGKITIVDREALQALACECYDMLRTRAPA